MAVDDLYQKACEAVENGNYGYAIQLYREVLRQEPEHPNARVALRGTERRLLEQRGVSAGHKIVAAIKGVLTCIKSIVALGNARKRLEYYEDLLEHDPNSMSALISAAKAARAAGYSDAAILMLKDALKLNPYHKGALRLISSFLQEAGKRKDGVGYLVRLAELLPKDRELQQEVRDLQAVDHMKTYEMEEAESFRDLLREKVEAPSGEEGAIEERAGAIAEARKAVEEDPENPTKIARLAGLQEDTGDYDNALNTLGEAAERMPDNYMVRERLGDVQLRMRQRAVKEAQSQLEKEPERADLKEKLSQLQQECREFAVREYKWRVERHPTDLNLQFELARAFFDVGNLNEAIAALQRASSAAALAIECARMLGLCFMRKKQYDLAIEQYERAIERHPETDERGQDMNYLLGEAYEANGQKEEALRVYKRIYSADINFRDVARKVDSLSS